MEADEFATQPRVEAVDQTALMGLREHVRLRLRVAIVGGRFRNNERLNERQLAKDLGVSTTPLKEALRQLESEGLVATRPRQGIYVTFDESKAEEMALARAALESVIARLAARRMTDDAVAALGLIVERMKSATELGDIDALIRLNGEFHEAINVAARSAHIYRLVQTQRVYDDAARRVIHSDTDERQRALVEHMSIYEAIAAHEPARAEAAMRAHVLRSAILHIEKVFGTKRKASEIGF